MASDYNRAPPAVSPGARAFHDSLIVIDGHCDTVLDLVGASYTDGSAPPRDFLERGKRGHIDLPRLLEGGVTCQAMALFTDNKLVPQAREHTWRLLETIEALHSGTDRIVPATKAADILRAKAGGRLATLLTIEGAEAIGGPAGGEASGAEAEAGIAALREFHGRGVRLMGLTWSRRNALGRGVESPGAGGLSPFGRRVVGEMEGLGMIVDASHLADESLKDLLEIAERPVVASHSNCRALCGHPRNLTDAQAEGIAGTGGLVAMVFAGLFIDPDPAKVSFGRFMDHLEHFLALLGPDHVGLGSDFDGWTESFGVALPDCTWIPAITASLLDRGHAPEVVAKVMGGNWLRVIGEIAG